VLVRGSGGMPPGKMLEMRFSGMHLLAAIHISVSQTQIESALGWVLQLPNYVIRTARSRFDLLHVYLWFWAQSIWAFLYFWACHLYFISMLSLSWACMMFRHFAYYIKFSPIMFHSTVYLSSFFPWHNLAHFRILLSTPVNQVIRHPEENHKAITDNFAQ